MANIAILGAGYVGLTTGACLAKLGNSVIVSDVNHQKVTDLNNGICPIVEDGLPELLNECVSKSMISFVVDNKAAVANSDFVFLCLPTPQRPDGAADTSYVEDAVKEIASYLKPETVIVTKSTVPVGSSAIIEKALQRREVAVVSNPEFLREGSALHDFFFPDRIVIGSNDANAAEKVADLYGSLNTKIIITDPPSAETIKYAANAFLATKLSFINAIAAVCEGVGADVLDVIEGIGSDSRIGKAFLNPGPGWGGSCFPKDTKAMVRIAQNVGYDFALLRGVIDVNEQQLERVASKVLSFQQTDTKSFRVGILGLTFKAGTDDRRDSPAIRVAQMLISQHTEVHAYDPTVSPNLSASDLTGIIAHQSAFDCIENADVILVATEWTEFKDLDAQQVGERVRSKNIVDSRNILDEVQWRNQGFRFIGVGR
jgi:UDPglucose 6-dehydrogenase